MRLTPEEFKRYQELWNTVGMTENQSEEWVTLFDKLFHCEKGHPILWHEAVKYPEGGCWKCRSDQTQKDIEALLKLLEKPKE